MELVLEETYKDIILFFVHANFCCFVEILCYSATATSATIESSFSHKRRSKKEKQTRTSLDLFPRYYGCQIHMICIQMHRMQFHLKKKTESTMTNGTKERLTVALSAPRLTKSNNTPFHSKLCTETTVQWYQQKTGFRIRKRRYRQNLSKVLSSGW